MLSFKIYHKFDSMPAALVKPPPSDIQWLPVHALRFTHDTIRPLFRSGQHCGSSLYTLVNELCKDSERTMASLPALEVVWHEGLWRSLSNRRLWCLKAYAGMLGRWDLNVKVKVLHHLPSNYSEKCTTANDGLSVLIDGDEEHNLETHLPSFLQQPRLHKGQQLFFLT